MAYKIDYKIVECMQPKNDCYKKGQKHSKSGIVRHNTSAGNPNLKRYIDDPERLGKKYYPKDTCQGCVHQLFFFSLKKFLYCLLQFQLVSSVELSLHPTDYPIYNKSSLSDAAIPDRNLLPVFWKVLQIPLRFSVPNQ